MNMKQAVRLGLLIMAVFLAGIFVSRLLNGPGRAEAGDDTVGTARQVSSARNRELTISQETQKLSGIQTERLSPLSSRERMKAYGQVIDLQSLIELANNYATAEANVKKSAAQVRVSRNEYKRVKALFDFNKNVSQKDLQSTEAAYISDEADSQAAVQNLVGLEGEIRLQWGKVIADWVRHRSAMMTEIVHWKVSILLITVPTGEDLSDISSSAEIQTNDGTFIRADFVSSSPKTDPSLQGISYFYRVSAISKLPAGTNIVAYLPVGRSMTGVIIPDSAVVWSNGSAWFYLKTSSDTFVRLKVSMQSHVTGGWFVTEGVKPGDEIVIKGSQLLLSQASKAQVRGEDD